jgi:hypothetical protein
MDIAEKVLRQKKDFDDVYEAGKKAEYDKMWDVIQPEGTISYANKFMGTNFNFDNFYPKRDIRPEGNAAQMFYAWEYGNCKGDLKARIEECGIVLDTSKATNLQRAFTYSRITVIPVIDFTGLTTSCSDVFSNSWGNLKTIEKIIVNETVTYTNWFTNDTGLTNVIVEGTIGQNGFDIHWSTKLSADSLKSIINALSTTTTGLTITLPTTAQSNYEAVYGSGSWATLVATRSNWTIAYA